MGRATPLVRAIGAAIASAVALGLAAPPVGAAWLAWVALVPVAAVVLADPGGRGARLAVPLAYALYLELLLVPAFPFGIADGQWGEPPLPVMVGDSPVLAVALLAVPLVGAALYAIRFGQPWGAELLPPPLAGVALVAIPALAWTALDFARALADPGGFWGPLFLPASGTPAGQLGALAGPWLLTLAVVAVNYALALALVRRRALAVAPAAALLALMVALGALPSTAGGARGGGDGEVRVAAVQPGYDTAEDGRPELRHFERGTWDLAALDAIRDLGSLTREAADRGAELVVWPEATIWLDPRSDRRVRGALARLARRSGATIVVPFFLPDEARGAALAVVPDPAAPGGARLTAARPKQRPMWFLGERGAGIAEPEPIDAAGLRLGTLLGVDSKDPGVAGALSAGGAELLAVATHDWRQLAPQHRSFDRLAALAAGAPLVRADWRFGSAIYAADGRRLASAGDELRRTATVADVVPSAGPTPYARSGDWLGWLSVAASAALLLASLTARLARRRPPATQSAPAPGA